MSNTSESPFRATLNVDVQGHRVLVTAGGDTISDFNIRWAEVAEQAQHLIESWNLVVAAANAAALVQHAPAPAPGAAPINDPWAQPAAPQGWQQPPQQANFPPQQQSGHVCLCGQAMKLVPAAPDGRYSAFYACPKPRGQQCSNPQTGKGYTISVR